jgi:hypothetical protein
LIVACAPFLLTGIENVIKRGDLAQRTLYIHLASVPDVDRITERAFRARFKRAHADLLGALCAAASIGLRVEKTLNLAFMPRLATFFEWASACEPALWGKGEFRRAFAANARDATEDVIEAETAASVLLRFLADRERGKFEGTATELLAELVAFVRQPVREAEAAHARAVRDKDDVEREKTAAALREARETVRDILGNGWPKAPNALTGKLKRASPALRNAGVRIEWPTRHGGAKVIKIERSGSEIGPQTASHGDQPSRLESHPNDINDLAEDLQDDPGAFGDRPAFSGDGRAQASGDAHGGDGPEKGGTNAGPAPLGASSSDKLMKSHNNLAAKMPRGQRDDVCGPLCDAEGSLSGANLTETRSIPPTPPDTLVSAARWSGAHLRLSEDQTLFTLEWQGPEDRLITDALRAGYDGVLDYLKREAESAAKTARTRI